MNKPKVTISEEQAEEWGKELEAIAEDNEKHERSALYYLVSAAECSYNIIKMGDKILKENRYPKDINCFCGCNLYFTSINKVKMNPNWLPEKDKEVNDLYNIMNRALDLFDKFDSHPKNILPNMQVQRFIFAEYVKIIEYVIQKGNLRDKFNKTDKLNHIELIKFNMDVGNYSQEETNFFLDYFIYQNKEVA